MARYINEWEILKLLDRATAEGQAKWGREHGFPPQTINDILHGRRVVSDRIARALGYERIPTRYRRVSE